MVKRRVTYAFLAAENAAFDMKLSVYVALLYDKSYVQNRQF
jgi:hypothetical protein